MACGEASKWVWLCKEGAVLYLLNNGLFHLMTIRDAGKSSGQ